jgi:hypothetical protein
VAVLYKGKQGFAQAHWHGEPHQFTELLSRCALLVRENPLATTRLATVTHLSGLDIDSQLPVRAETSPRWTGMGAPTMSR